ncbi:hypothetical protein C2E23DRAFT_849273 [Lenzites betulinus]|nr:hypothetical protein C2E23DRAFT_849273 [Lenzites betulinus]
MCLTACSCSPSEHFLLVLSAHFWAISYQFLEKFSFVSSLFQCFNVYVFLCALTALALSSHRDRKRPGMQLCF